MERHFTATTYVIQADRILLLMHPKIRKWLPPGGHVEENETPAECAKREVLEETGLHIAFIQDEHIWLSYPNAYSSERPFLCLVETVPAYLDKKEHQHIDFIYLSYPTSGTLFSNPDELRWFSLEEIMQLEAIFPDTLDVIQMIFKQQYARA